MPTVPLGADPAVESGCSGDIEMASGDFDVTGQHGLEERVQLLGHLPSEVALCTGGALFHRDSEDNCDATRPLGHLRSQNRNPFALIAPLAPHHRRLRKSADQRAGSGSYTVTTRSSWCTSFTITTTGSGAARTLSYLLRPATARDGRHMPDCDHEPKKHSQKRSQSAVTFSGDARRTNCAGDGTVRHSGDQ